MKTLLNDRQKIVIECVYKQFSEKQSLIYLKDQGFDISERTLRRDKTFIKKNSLLRLYQLAKVDFGTLHQERIDKLKMMEAEMWKNYNEIRDPYKRILALERIANINPIISAYEDTAQYVLEKSNPNKESDKTIPV